MSVAPLQTPTTEATHVSELFSTLVDAWRLDPRELRGYPTTRWKVFNDAFGGFRPGELVTITAETGVGKTTFALNWLLDAVQQGHHGFLISLEERWAATACRLAAMTNGKPFSKFTGDDLGGINLVWADWPLWYLDAHGPVKDERALKVIRAAAVAHQIKLVVIDHMDYLVRTQSMLEGDSYVIGHFLRRLCGLAHELALCVLLIAHPRKTEVKGIVNREIGMDELKGSSSIKQESDAVLSLYQPDREKNETIVRFQKIRSVDYSKNTMSYVRFAFENDTLWMREISKQREWGNP